MSDPSDPRTTSSRLSRIGLAALRGWKIQGHVHAEPKAVILAAPHTTNMDGLLLVLLTRSVGLHAHWMVKDTWTKPPAGWLTTRVGAVPINRQQANGVVGQMVDEFAAHDHFHLMIPPEGTRSHVDHWKSGFYQIALEAAVPVIPSYVDYRTRRGGFGPPTMLTGDRAADMDVVRDFYRDGAAMAKHPEKFGPVRLRDESPDADR